MKVYLVGVFLALGMSSSGIAVAQQLNILELSRAAAVMVQSKTGNSKGSGFLIGDQYVVTCFHVVAAVSAQGPTVNWKLHPDLEVILSSGETIGATVISAPTQSDPSPLVRDFAVLRLKSKPSKKHSTVQLASDKDKLTIGDNVVFSGFPLATPGMVTHRGMISGTDQSGTLIFVQAPINKGNSGGALLNDQGRVVGIVSMREGGISKGLQELQVHIDQTSSQGSVRIMGVDPLQATNAIIQTLDKYISTGIGYAWSIKFVREYLDRHTDLLKSK